MSRFAHPTRLRTRPTGAYPNALFFEGHPRVVGMTLAETFQGLVSQVARAVLPVVSGVVSIFVDAGAMLP